MGFFTFFVRFFFVICGHDDFKKNYQIEMHFGTLYMYLQFWTFIERWQFFFVQNKIIDYVYTYGPTNIQSVMKYKLLFNLLKQKLFTYFSKKVFFIVQWTFRTVSAYALSGPIKKDKFIN